MAQHAVGSVAAAGSWARGLAGALVLALGVVTLAVAPPADAASGTDLPTTIQVTQPAPWTPAGSRALDVVVTGPDGVAVEEGAIVASVESLTTYHRSATPSGRLQLPSTPMLPGRYGATVTYVPAEGYAASTWTGEVVVEDGSVPTTVEISLPDEVPFDEPGVVGVRVEAASGTPEGMVGLRVPGGTRFQYGTLVGGRARVQVFGYGDPDAIGTTRDVEVVYFPSGGEQTSSASGSYRIGRMERALEIWHDVEWNGVWPVTQDPWKVSVHVPDITQHRFRDGTISLYAGDRLLRTKPFPNPGDERWVVSSFELSEKDLPVGKHRLTARLTGSTYIDDASTSFTMTVAKLATKTYPGRGTPGPLQVGRPLKLDAAIGVSRSDDEPLPTGTLTFYEGRTRLGTAKVSADGHGGGLTLGTRRWGLGKHTLRVVYSGDANYAGSSGTRTIGVYKAETSVRARVVDRKIGPKQRAKVKIRVSTPSDVPVTGKVRVRVNGDTVRTVVLKKRHDGRVTVKLPRRAGGTSWIDVVYTGSEKLKRSTTKAGKVKIRAKYGR